MHLTLTIPTHAYTWGQILTSAVDDVLEENPEFRSAFPVADLMWEDDRNPKTEALFEQKMGDVVDRISTQAPLRFVVSLFYFAASHLLCLFLSVSVLCFEIPRQVPLVLPKISLSHGPTEERDPVRLHKKRRKHQLGDPRDQRLAAMRRECGARVDIEKESLFAP